MKKIILPIIFLVFVSACITGQAPKITCEPKFLKQAESLEEDLCETQCYDKYKSLNYEYIDGICYCDIVGCAKETTTIETTAETTVETTIEIVTTEETTTIEETVETTAETTVETTTETTVETTTTEETTTVETTVEELTALEVSVTAEPNPLVRGNPVTITVLVLADSSAVEAAEIEAKIVYASGYTVTNSGVTDSEGKFTWTKTIGGNATPGTFTAEAEATKEGYEAGQGSTTFEVTEA